MPDLDFSDQASAYVPPKPLDFSGQATPLEKPGIVSQAGSAVAKPFGDILRGAAAGAQAGGEQVLQDLTTPIDTERYRPDSGGLRGELEAPFAPAIGEVAGLSVRAAKTAMDFFGGIPVSTVEGAISPATVPALQKVYEQGGMSPEDAKANAEAATANIAQLPFIAEGGIRGPHAPEINPEKFAPVPERSIYTTVVPPKVVPTGPLADAATAHGPVGAVLDAFSEGPKSNWGAPDYVSKLDTKSAPADVLKRMAQGQDDVSKGFNEAFQRSAASQALVQAGPDITSQLTYARSFGIIGEGEGGWSGLVAPDEAASEARRTAAAMVEPEGPEPAAFDIHETARQSQPDLFHGPDGYDTLDQQRTTLRNSLSDLVETRSTEAVKDIDAKLAEFPGEHPEQVFDKAADLMDERDAILAKIRQQGDTPEITQIRQAIQETDYKMRDLAPRVSAAYRDAQERGPVAPAEEARPVSAAEPEAAPPAVTQEAPAVAAEVAPPAQSPEPAVSSRPIPTNVAADVSQKLVAAGRPAEEANAAGALVQAHYEARAARFDGKLGTGPELYAREAPEVRAGRVRAASVERAREYAQAKEQTESPAFKKWFGDSKVLDADGQPRVVYHGTSADVPEFDKGKLGNTTGARSAEKGFFFSSDPAVASSYAVGRNGYEANAFIDFINKKTGGLYQKFNERLLRAVGMKSQIEHGENVVPVHLAIKNPMEVDFEGNNYREQSFASLIDDAKDGGHDGVVFRNAIDPGYAKGGEHPSDVYVAFEPTQIKSAIGNRGTFDPSDPRILNQSARGKIAFRDGQATITLMKDANASTFIHETGHQWLEELNRDAEHDQAPADLTKDAQTVRDYLGVKDGEEITTRQHEKFARSFERYMMEGTAPSKGLADVFAKFKNWLTQIYQTVAKLRAPISDDIRAVFDRLLTSGDERAVIAPDRLDKTLADLHEDDDLHTAPEHADPVRDTIRQEVVQLAERDTPDIVPALTNDGEAGGGPTEAGGNTGGNSPAGSGSGATGDAQELGKVAEGGGKSGTEGPSVRAEPGANAGSKSSQSAGAEPGLAAPNSDLIDKAGNIRLDNINTAEDFKQALRDAADRNNDFLERRRNVVTDQQRQSIAITIGTTPDKVFSKLVGESFTDSEIKFLEKSLADSASLVHDLSVKAASGGEAEILAMTKAYLRHDMIQGLYSQATAESARAFRALQKSQEFWSKDALATKNIIEQQVGDATGKTLYQMRAIAKKIAQMDSPGQISKMVRDSNRKGLFDWLQAAFVNALNSGPLTHLGYTSAGETFALFRATAETSAAALVGKIRETAGLGEDQYASIHEMPHQLYGMYRGAQSGIKAAWQAAKSNEVILPKEVQDLQGRSSTTGRPIVSTRVIPNPKIAGRTVPIGTVLESPGRMIAALHTFNWTTFYSQSIAGQAFRQALSEGIDLSSPRFAERVAKITMSPTDAMIEEASNDANSGALMNRAEHGTFMAKVSALTNHGIPFPDIPLGNGKSFPLGTFRPLKYIDPFVQIQANVQKAAFGRGTPLALFSQAVRDDLSMRNGGVAFDRTAGRILAGTTFMVAAGGLAAQGILNGSGPSSRKELALWQRVHGMQHGLAIGNMSYDTLRLGNLGLQMSVAADLYQVAHAIGEGDAAKATSQVVEAFAQNIMDESSMRGPSEMMKAIDDKDRYGAAWIRNFAASAIPFSTGLGQISHQIDPYSREARTTMDAIKSKIPFASEALQPRFDVWGVPVPNRGWAVTPTQQISQDPIDKHLLDLGLYPTVVRREITGVKLTDQQYADYSRMSGQLAHRLVSNLLQTPNFDNFPAEERMKLFDGAVEHARKQAAGVIQKSSAGTKDDIYAQALAAKRAAMH